MGRGGKVPRRVAPIEPPDEMCESGHYPLGKRPSWTEIKGFMGRGAQELMLSWVCDPEWGSEHATAARLFTRFTREYFATLKIDILRADVPSPINLEDAMKTWNVQELRLTLISCWFVASNHGLKGVITGAKSLSFREQALAFFPPDPETLTDSPWALFLEYGYLRDYSRALQELGEDEEEALVEAIGDIFSHVQCVPVTLRPSSKSKGKLWTTTEEGIHFVANPVFYKLKQVGPPKKRTMPDKTRLQRVKVSNIVTLKRLAQMNGESIQSAVNARRARRMAKQRMKRLSAKNKK